MTKTGLTHLLHSPPDWLKNKRLGLLYNQASVDERLRPAPERIAGRLPGQIKALFTPQHGAHGARQDNMVESGHFTDPVLNVPVYSLYSETRRPRPEWLDGLDVLLVDLQDAGTRVYTFITTLSYCMEAAREAGAAVCILDRPNPVGGAAVEGGLLRADCASFVGRYPLPMRHGFTLAEIARLFNEDYDIGCRLEIIPMTGWNRTMFYQDTGLAWIPPSPNLPMVESAMVYPGQVIWEGANVSEGRGITRPFETFGAPFVEPRAVLDFLGDDPLHGAYLRPTAFEPCFHKWAGQLCFGFHIHVLDKDVFQPYLGSLRLLHALMSLYPNDFAWKEPPYEYETERLPMDLILGDSNLRRALENGEDPRELARAWAGETEAFKKQTSRFHLYG